MNSTRTTNSETLTIEDPLFERYADAASNKLPEGELGAEDFRGNVKDRVASVLLSKNSNLNRFINLEDLGKYCELIAEQIRRYMEYLIYNVEMPEFRYQLSRSDKIYFEDLTVAHVIRYIRDLKAETPRLVRGLEKQGLDPVAVVRQLEEIFAADLDLLN
jgi:hypothetical protein